SPGASTLRRPLQSPLFPYTTLFRSISSAAPRSMSRRACGSGSAIDGLRLRFQRCAARLLEAQRDPLRSQRFLHAVLTQALTEVRSEEHTSELQSRENLVCRLLLEKK